MFNWSLQKWQISGNGNRATLPPSGHMNNCFLTCQRFHHGQGDFCLKMQYICGYERPNYAWPPPIYTTCPPALLAFAHIVRNSCEGQDTWESESREQESLEYHVIALQARNTERKIESLSEKKYTVKRRREFSSICLGVRDRHNSFFSCNIAFVTNSLSVLVILILFF